MVFTYPVPPKQTQKPIMEKRRRARINSYLNELKVLVLRAMKKNQSPTQQRDIKLEKADILELTVKHLQRVQRQQLPLMSQAKSVVLEKFRTGFGDCAEEVVRYINRLEGVDPGMKSRLRNHLNSCMNNLSYVDEPTLDLCGSAVIPRISAFHLFANESLAPIDPTYKCFVQPLQQHPQVSSTVAMAPSDSLMPPVKMESDGVWRPW